MDNYTYILLIEDNPSYTNVVNQVFTQNPSHYNCQIIPVDNISEAIKSATLHDFKVVIVDLALPNGEFGTETIEKIWSIDKKVIFIIHSILPAEKVHGWFSDHFLPHTSRFYLQKTGFDQSEMQADAVSLHKLVLKAIDCYVPHFEPTIVSVRDSVNLVENFWSQNKSFNRSPIIANLHYSQDVINETSSWANDKLTRPGYATTRICAVLVGSFGRLEAGQYSDADCFLVFDDRGLLPDDLSELISITHHGFIQLGKWFEKLEIPIHDFDTEDRRPEKIDWHTTTLPTWFPLSTFKGNRLGVNTQIELSKLWFLFEGYPVFNKQLFNQIHNEICKDFNLFPDRTNRDNVIHSDINVALKLLSQSFNKKKRRRQSFEDLIVIKHSFLRDIYILSHQLFLLQCFLDDKLYDKSGSFLISGLRTPSLEKLINFYNFVTEGNTFSSKRRSTYKTLLKNICNSYADGLHKLGYKSIREAITAEHIQRHEREMVNDLLQSSSDCEQRVQELRNALATDPIVYEHNELKRFWHT